MTNLLANVIHELVVSTRDVDFRDDARLQSVHEFAKNDAVAEGILVW